MNRARYTFRLYVSDGADDSKRALANLLEFCRSYVRGCTEIEEIDVVANARRARADGVTMAPTLVVVAPSSTVRIVGVLDDPMVMLQAINYPRSMCGTSATETRDFHGAWT